MIYRKLHSLFLVLVLSGTAHANEAVGPNDLTSTGQNALGYSGWNGEFNTWWDLGSLEVSPNLVIPIRFNFNSKQSSIGNSVLGLNWWAPLIESTVVKDKEDQVIARMPGGLSVYFFKSNNDPKCFRSRDHKWEGRVDNKGNFKVINQAEGVTMDFFKGQLKSTTLSTGEILTWDYDPAGKPLSIKNSSGFKLVSVTYGSSGFPERLEYQGIGQKTQTILTRIDNVFLGEDRVFPELVSLNAPENNTRGFKYELTSKDVLSFSALNQIDSDKQDEEKFAWGVSDGILISAKGETYKISKNADVLDMRIKTHPGGLEESYTYNYNTNVGVLNRNGQRIERYYIANAGPLFGKERKATFSKLDNSYRIEYIRNYDVTGKLLRSITSEFNHNKLVENQIEIAQQTAVRYSPDRSIRYDYDNDGSLIRISQNGKIIKLFK